MLRLRFDTALLALGLDALPGAHEGLGLDEVHLVVDGQGVWGPRHGAPHYPLGAAAPCTPAVTVQVQVQVLQLLETALAPTGRNKCVVDMVEVNLKQGKNNLLYS